jgi:hypothetical protein
VARFRPAIIGCACLLVAACGGTTKQASIERPEALRLANSSDAVAAALAAGDSCLAQTRARTLRLQVAAAVAAGSIPPRLASDARAASTRLVSTIACTPPPPAPPTATPPPAALPCNEHNAQKPGRGHQDHDSKGKGRKAHGGGWE